MALNVTFCTLNPLSCADGRQHGTDAPNASSDFVYCGVEVRGVGSYLGFVLIWKEAIALSTFDSHHPDYLCTQRSRVDELLKQADAGAARQKELTAATVHTWRRIDRTYTDLMEIFESRQPSSGNYLGHCLSLTAPLTDAVKILETEFSDVEGSGQGTLLKCRAALRRVQFMVVDGGQPDECGGS